MSLEDPVSWRNQISLVDPTVPVGPSVSGESRYPWRIMVSHGGTVSLVDTDVH